MKERPRLAPHVLPRLYSSDESYVVLYDTEALRSHPISRRAWNCVAAMDGTRDLDGLAAVLVARGAGAGRDEVVTFVQELDEHGLLLEGVVEPTRDVDREPRPTRPILQLPNYKLHCSGKGSCCRFYPSIAFTPHDVAKARAHCPDVEDGGHDERRVFVPLVGVDSPMRAVGTRDGKCTYLGADGLCGIHCKAGEQAKPAGCSLYPSRFVDDGVAVRVVPHLECACVFTSDSAPSEDSATLLPASVTTSEGLPSAASIERLQDPVIMTHSETASLREAAAFFEARAESGPDVVASFLDLARDAATREPRTQSASPTDHAELFQAALLALEGRVKRLANEPWRSSRDLVRVTANALVMAIDLAKSNLEELLEGGGGFHRHESFYYRTHVFGFGLVARSGTRSVRVAAFDRAFRVLVGRALAVVVTLADLRDHAFDAPLALVEASMRGYGLAAYIRDIETEVEGAFAQSLLK